MTPKDLAEVALKDMRDAWNNGDKTSIYLDYGPDNDENIEANNKLAAQADNLVEVLMDEMSAQLERIETFELGFDKDGYPSDIYHKEL